MIDLLEAAAGVQKFCDKRGWRSCIIGGIAVQRWGEPRVTRDIDLTILTGFGGEEEVVRELLSAYEGRIQDARNFALQRRVLLLRTGGGVGVDVSLGALPFEESVVMRATPFSFGPNLDIRTCSAEDLIVLKLFASRPLDIHDAESVAVRQKQLDWNYIEEQLQPLAEAKEAPEILDVFTRLRTRYS
jgi:hypothetical protein